MIKPKMHLPSRRASSPQLAIGGRAVSSSRSDPSKSKPENSIPILLLTKHLSKPLFAREMQGGCRWTVLDLANPRRPPHLQCKHTASNSAQLSLDLSDTAPRHFKFLADDRVLRSVPDQHGLRQTPTSLTRAFLLPSRSHLRHDDNHVTPERDSPRDCLLYGQVQGTVSPAQF